jgi:broad specificity phosphatase PhoE
LYKENQKLALKHIYLIRHGQTDYNVQGIVQGSSVDTSLNETGRLQAQLFYESYKDVPFDKIYTSKLKRTHQSVQGFINQGIPWEQHEGLNEISWGKYDGVLPSPEERAIQTEIMLRWSKGETKLTIGGGESPEQVLKRQKPVWDLILSRTKEKNVLVCIHGRAIRILMCYVMGVPLKEMDAFMHDNLCLYLLEYDGDEVTVLKSNSIEHLNDPVSS